MARQKPDRDLAPDLRDVGLRPLSRALGFRAGANYFKGDHVALWAEVGALTSHANVGGT